MAKLSQLNQMTCTVDVYGDSHPGLLVVDYRPSRFHQDLMKELEAIQRDPEKSDADKLDANTKWICHMVSGWNIEADESTEKNPVYLPVTEEVVRSLGIPRQNQIIKAIMADIERGN